MPRQSLELPVLIGQAIPGTRSPSCCTRDSQDHQGHIDLLLTDVVMPSMQGTEVADAISVERPSIVIVYMSGHALSAFDDHHARPIAFIEKPFAEEDLRKVLGEHLPD